MSIKNAANLLASTQIAGGSIVEGVEALWSWNGTDITQFGDGAGTPDYTYGTPDGTLSVGAVPTSGIDVPSGDVLLYTTGTATSATAFFAINDLPALPERFIFRCRLGPRGGGVSFPMLVTAMQDELHYFGLTWETSYLRAVVGNNNDALYAAGLYRNVTGNVPFVDSGVVIEVDVMLRDPDTGIDPQVNQFVWAPGGGSVHHGKGGLSWTAWGGSGAAYDSSWQSGGTIKQPGFAFVCNGTAQVGWISELQIFPHPSGFGTAQTVAVEGVESNLWAVPATPHASNDEFDGTDLSGWTGVQNITDAVAGTISYDAVNSYDSTFTSGNVVRVNMDERQSWALIQVPAATKAFSFYKSITLPTNLLVVARFKHILPAAQGTSNGEIALFLAAATGGVPTLASRLNMIINASVSGSNRSLVQCYNSGGGTYGTTIGDTVADGMPFFPEYAAIHKVGSNYHFWVGSGQGAWVHYTSQVASGFTPDLVGFHALNTGTGGAGVPVVGIDYIRFYETANFFL